MICFYGSQLRHAFFAGLADSHFDFSIKENRWAFHLLKGEAIRRGEFCGIEFPITDSLELKTSRSNRVGKFITRDSLVKPINLGRLLSFGGELPRREIHYGICRPKRPRGH